MTMGLGIVLLLLGVWQGYASVRYFRQIKQHGTAGTSSFALLAAWSGAVMGIILIAAGIMALTGYFS